MKKNILKKFKTFSCSISKKTLIGILCGAATFTVLVLMFSAKMTNSKIQEKQEKLVAEVLDENRLKNRISSIREVATIESEWKYDVLKKLYKSEKKAKKNKVAAASIYTIYGTCKIGFDYIDVEAIDNDAKEITYLASGPKVFFPNISETKMIEKELLSTVTRTLETNALSNDVFSEAQRNVEAMYKSQDFDAQVKSKLEAQLRCLTQTIAGADWTAKFNYQK